MTRRSRRRTAGRSTLDVTVVLPVHNEAGHLRAEVDRVEAALEASAHSFEILVVDDGSTDGSLDELADLVASDAVRVIRFAENRGSGSARKAGTRAAHGRVVVWTDADMTYPNDQIPTLVKELDGYDQVVGARTSEQGTHRAARVPAKWFIRKLASFLVEKPDSRSQLGLPGVPPRRGVAVRLAAPRGIQLRHHDHDDVPRERLLGEVRADRLRAEIRAARSSTGGATPGAT